MFRAKVWITIFCLVPTLATAAPPGSTPIPEVEDLEEDDGSAIEVPATERLESAEPIPDETPDLSSRRNLDVPAQAEKPSSSSGEPGFDWSKHKGATQVPHPHVEKGLIRITKDSTFFYRVDETETKRAASIHVGVFAPTNLRNPDQQGAGATFEENYDQRSNPAILLMYEWQLWKTPIGRIGVQAGTGAFIATGHGHFVGATNAGKTPLEVFTFITLPNTLGAIYRMHFWRKQLFVPYGGGGLMPLAFMELRDDNKAPKFGGALHGYFNAGVGLNLTYFDYLSRIQLNREYGISAVYLTVEYRHILAITQRYDFSTPYANGGFAMEF